jgi:hypothetical protein
VFLARAVGSWWLLPAGALLMLLSSRRAMRFIFG